MNTDKKEPDESLVVSGDSTLAQTRAQGTF
jgi:hypothetical protein